ncbi:urea ABC transporter permease subunit UrtB [Phaeobacter gallaeciensis]|uniref:urea ABC transporter permease subunit UrtB n=1 Tax=Phaeobacter gallaeciensis TaxID=60890 RepID=UPI00237F3C67|nr:urea ABC transporter permease subunit UrtB [Phaeobacter gallaeciensis]MDE4098232.1 urea ABC transporter permease subunit UrtB [Phaeobacter gallaeciensis]MDE4107042.1 urea ABC transporter permease subunit UrtB [Phaeobacter gallaeciensis]MDE4111499.1 urea ABC transporter permease subunit UrtB [Phaeobacter gallaeciensis]MDE4115967.1 urea ABC transporter permease subunit UrtB [Phaeobacter gallaeciensis]MDE4120440.1 urea ABC transporter permease subunit UrtB [Phaeobacter gallaeciensis]
MKRLFLACLALFCACQVALAQTPAGDGPLQQLLQENRALIEKSSRTSIGPVITAIADSGLPQARGFLEAWQNKDIWQRKEDGLFFVGEEVAKRTYALSSPDDGTLAGEYPKKELKQLKPNSGVRALIATALVQFQLSDPDPATRAEGLLAIERAPGADLLAPLRASIPGEEDPVLKARKTRLERLLTIAYGADEAERIDAIKGVSNDLSVDVRAALNPLVAVTVEVAEGLPEDRNIARTLTPGEDGISRNDAYDMLVAAGHVPARTTADALRQTLAEHIEGGRVAGVPLAQLSNEMIRQKVYDSLASDGKVDPFVGEEAITIALSHYVFFETYAEPSAAVTDAAEQALESIGTKVALNQAVDLGLDAVSLASIYFLAAIGLAITFGLMGVINMAHGEFIMMGAYTGYVVQQIIPNHTVSILVAIPLAFAVTFAAGVAMERLVIRHLYNRPLETLLATFGISIALQQLAKNIFGTQARPLTAPGWLDGAWMINDVVSISYIRIAIFVLALIFLALFLFIMRRTRLGLETRAVTQNPRMASSMGINPGRVNMLTFGLGSGIAGIAGVAIGLFAKVTSELGQDYIVQSFMTVVVGGVGNIFGTLAGAAMIGSLQKGIEWLNPSNTLAAQTYMIIFIIIFIQFRPRGIIALKGRAAGD